MYLSQQPAPMFELPASCIYSLYTTRCKSISVQQCTQLTVVFKCLKHSEKPEVTATTVYSQSRKPNVNLKTEFQGYFKCKDRGSLCIGNLYDLGFQFSKIVFVFFKSNFKFKENFLKLKRLGLIRFQTLYLLEAQLILTAYYSIWDSNASTF